LDDYETELFFAENIRQRQMKRLDFVEVDIMSRLSTYTGLKYFYDETIAPLGELTYIDGGAYDGDTIIDFCDRYRDNVKKIYAFEPDGDNMQRLIKNTEFLKIEKGIEYIHSGIGKNNETLRFNSNGDISSGFSETGDAEINVYTIDSVVNEVVGTLCIKMDIEGFELDALKGAEHTIVKYHPYLSICIYHKYVDFFEIPHYLKSLYGGYKFYLRCGFHSELYAVPCDR